MAIKGMKATRPHVVSAKPEWALQQARFKYKNVGSIKKSKKDPIVYWVKARKGKRLAKK